MMLLPFDNLGIKFVESLSQRCILNNSFNESHEQKCGEVWGSWKPNLIPFRTLNQLRPVLVSFVAQATGVANIPSVFCRSFSGYLKIKECCNCSDVFSRHENVRFLMSLRQHVSLRLSFCFLKIPQQIFRRPRGVGDDLASGNCSVCMKA